MLMIANLPTLYCHKNIIKHQFEIWWMDLIPDLCIRYDTHFACVWLTLLVCYSTLREGWYWYIFTTHSAVNNG